MRRFSTSAAAQSIAVRFRPRNAYANRPKVEEMLRRDIVMDIEEQGFGDIDAVAEVSEAGAHRGGTNPAEPLHTTVYLVDSDGNQIMKTIHVYHDEKEFESAMQG